MLRGCEKKGYVIASAAKTSLLLCDHRPVWIQQQLQSKSTLVGSVECMQVINVFMSSSYKFFNQSITITLAAELFHC